MEFIRDHQQTSQRRISGPLQKAINKKHLGLEQETFVREIKREENWSSPCEAFSCYILPIDQMYKILVYSQLNYCGILFHLPPITNHCHEVSLIGLTERHEKVSGKLR